MAARTICCVGRPVRCRRPSTSHRNRFTRAACWVSTKRAVNASLSDYAGRTSLVLLFEDECRNCLQAVRLADVRATPLLLIVDASGKVRQRELGSFKENDLDAWLLASAAR